MRRRVLLGVALLSQEERRRRWGDFFGFPSQEHLKRARESRAPLVTDICCIDILLVMAPFPAPSSWASSCRQWFSHMTQALEAPFLSVPPSDTLLVIDGFILDCMILPSCVLLLLVARCFGGQLCCTLTMLQMSCHLHTRRVLVKLDCHAVSSFSACPTMSAHRAYFLWVAPPITIFSSWTFFRSPACHPRRC